MNDGKIEQVGGPLELYDRPANRFVMCFLGPVSQIGGALVRPHDIHLESEPLGNAAPGKVTRIVHLGFEVRVELDVEGAGARSPPRSRATTRSASQLVEGRQVWVRTPDTRLRRERPRAGRGDASPASPPRRPPPSPRLELARRRVRAVVRRHPGGDGPGAVAHARVAQRPPDRQPHRPRAEQPPRQPDADARPVDPRRVLGHVAARRADDDRAAAGTAPGRASRARRG